MNGKLGWALGLAAAAFLMAGCPSTNTDNAGGGMTPTDSSELAAMAKPYILEVPTPVGFKYKDEKSKSATFGNGRYINHIYNGSADKYAVARFYRKQMPVAGWALKPETQSQGAVFQEYDRKGETCRIRIYDGGLFDRTEIEVTVFSNPQAEGPPPARNK